MFLHFQKSHLRLIPEDHNDYTEGFLINYDIVAEQLHWPLLHLLFTDICMVYEMGAESVVSKC